MTGCGINSPDPMSRHGDLTTFTTDPRVIGSDTGSAPVEHQYKAVKEKQYIFGFTLFKFSVEEFCQYIEINYLLS